jgi:hypothetical protein
VTAVGVVFVLRRDNQNRRGEAILSPNRPCTNVVAKRMNKRHQMRWNRATVQPFLDVRGALLNDTRSKMPSTGAIPVSPHGR